MSDCHLEILQGPQTTQGPLLSPALFLPTQPSSIIIIFLSIKFPKPQTYTLFSPFSISLGDSTSSVSISPLCPESVLHGPGPPRSSWFVSLILMSGSLWYPLDSLHPLLLSLLGSTLTMAWMQMLKWKSDYVSLLLKPLGGSSIILRIMALSCRGL